MSHPRDNSASGKAPAARREGPAQARRPVSCQRPGGAHEDLPPLSPDTVVGWDPSAAHLELNDQIFCARGMGSPEPAAGRYAQVIRRLVLSPASLAQLASELPLPAEELVSFVEQMVAAGFFEIQR